MAEIHIDIYGGNNQILPNATEIVQNFYLTENETEEIRPCTVVQPVEVLCKPLPPEALALLPYVRDEQALRRYVQQIEACKIARDLAEIIITLQEQEQKVPADEILKERFIRKFLPLAPQGIKGMTAHNVYTHITNLRANRPRKTGK